MQTAKKEIEHELEAVELTITDLELSQELIVSKYGNLKEDTIAYQALEDTWDDLERIVNKLKDRAGVLEGALGYYKGEE